MRAAMLAVMGLAAASGCTGRLVKEGLGGVTGGSGSVFVLAEQSGYSLPDSLAAYRSFELGAFSDDMLGRAPAGLQMYLSDAFAKALKGAKIANAPKGKTLLIRGRILHYEDASRLTKQLNPLEEAVARVEFVDKATGQVLCTANCVGRTDSTSSMGVRHKAEGLAKAILKYIDPRYPKDQRAAE